MFDLKKTEKHLLDCLDAAELASKKESTRCIVKIPPGFHFPIHKNINKELEKALDEIMRNDPIKTNLSEKYIKEQVENILFMVFSLPEDQRPDFLNIELIKFREIVKQKLKDEITDYKFTLHVNRLQIEDDFDVGQVRFYKLDENKADEINAEEVEKHHNFVQSITGGRSNFLKMGDTYAEVSTRGVQAYAYSLALYKIRLSLNIIKLFIDPDYCVFGLDGETFIPMHRKSFLNFKNKGPFVRMELVGGHPDYFLGKKDLEFMKEHGIDELNKILRKESKLSEYEKRLLTGIYWFGEAVSVITSENKDMGDGKRTNIIENFEFFNRGEKLLKLFTSLESVLIFSDKESITENIAERTPMIVFKEYDDRIEVKKRIKRIYGDRGKTVHQGITYVSKNDLSWLTDCVRATLCKLIELKKEYSFDSSKDLKEHIEKLKLT